MRERESVTEKVREKEGGRERAASPPPALPNEVQGYLAHNKPFPPRATIGPYAESYCRVLVKRCFL